jgi:hypothetical protein
MTHIVSLVLVNYKSNFETAAWTKSCAQRIYITLKMLCRSRVRLRIAELNSAEILFFQELIRRIPIPDNVLEYAVSLASKTRPQTTAATKDVNSYLSWGAGPRASQYLVIGAKCHAALNGKYSPDIK